MTSIGDRIADTTTTIISYILYWKNAKFQLEESENKDVNFFPPNSWAPPRLDWRSVNPN